MQAREREPEIMQKIAVMLPHPYRGGTLRAAKSIAKAISFETAKRKDPLQVVFSYPHAGAYDLREDFQDLSEMKIQLRETAWQVFPREVLEKAVVALGRQPAAPLADECCLPVDGANDFNDCDLWVIVSDRIPAPLFPLKKYVCVIYDYLQRYVPEVFKDSQAVWDHQERNMFPLVRGAERVFTTAPATRQDLINYAGVPSSRITLLDVDFEPPRPPNQPLSVRFPQRYLHWTTNLANHKNHIRALLALEVYYQELGGELDTVITGPATEYLDPARDFPEDDLIARDPHVKQAREVIKGSMSLRGRLQILGNLTDAAYANVLGNARFLFHPALYDAGTFSALEAAYLHRPTLSARYPAMEHLDRRFRLNVSFFDPLNCRAMAKAIRKMEVDHASIPLPKPETLEKSNWREQAPFLYGALLRTLKGAA